MNKIITKLILFSVTIVLVAGASAQTSEFAYQGKLNDSGGAANGQYDVSFVLYDTPTLGTILGQTSRDNVQVTNGVFTVSLNFGATPFVLGQGQYLEIGVRPGTATGVYTTLSPRQPVTGVPYAITAISADSLSASCVLCITNAQITSLDGSKVTGTVANALTANSVSGIVQIANGGTGSNIQDFVDLSTDQRRIRGDKEFTGTISVAAGGRFQGDGSGLTNVNANIADGSVTTPKLADGSVTAEKLALNIQSSTNLSLLGSRRWDVLNQKTITGNSPGEAAFDGANIWTVNTGSGNVTKIRVSDGSVVGTFAVGYQPHGITFDGANIWVIGGDGNGGTITKLRASDGVSQGTFTASTFLRSAIFDGANIWMTSFGGNVTKLRTSDGVNLGTFPSGSFSGGIAFDGTNIWVLNSSSGGNVTRLRVADASNAGDFLIGGGANAIAFDGSNMWISFPSGGPSGTGAVKKVRALDGVTLGTFAVSNNPTEIAFDGVNIWVTSNTGNYLTKLRATDGVELERFSTGGTPNGIVFDGANIWVTNSGNNVKKFPAFR